MNHHGIKKGGLEQLAQTLKQVQVDDQSTHPSIHQSFIASGRCIEPDAPACETVVKVNVVANPSAQGVTHTHTHPHPHCLRYDTHTTHTYKIYIYIHIYTYLCVCMCTVTKYSN